MWILSGRPGLNPGHHFSKKSFFWRGLPCTPMAAPPALTEAQAQAMLLKSMSKKATEALHAGKMTEHQLYCEQIIQIKQQQAASAPPSAREVMLHVYDLGAIHERVGSGLGAFHCAVRYSHCRYCSFKAHHSIEMACH